MPIALHRWFTFWILGLLFVQPLQAQAFPAPVYFMSGGTIDDDSASVLLATIDTIKLSGIQISNSDTLYQYAVQNQWKIQQFIAQPKRTVGLSNARGFNPFPWSYRNDAFLVWGQSILSQIADRKGWPPYPNGDAQMRNRLAQAYRNHEKVVILATAPLTPLANILKSNPHLVQTIKELVWMGGAIHVAGNLDPSTIPPEVANPKAEWNAFWDPYAVDWIFHHTQFPITLFPLDVTDQAKLDPTFLLLLKNQALKYRYSALVSSLYGLVDGQPYFEMWNTLTAAYLGRPELFQLPQTMPLEIITEGYWQGAILSKARGGRKVNVILNLKNPADFYAYVLMQLRRDN